MLQDNLSFIILIAVVGLAALLTSHIISSREKDAKARAERLKWLQQQAEHSLNALMVMRAAGCKAEIVDRIDAHAQTLIEEIGVLAPDSELLGSIGNLKASADRATASSVPMNSDRAIKRASIYIKFASQLLEEMAKANQLSGQLASSYAQDLHWLNVSIIATAHLAQGQKSLSLEDRPAALSHLKHAKAVLTRAMVPQQLKQDRLQQIQSLLDSLEPRPERSRGGILADDLEGYFRDR
ncbi:DNA topoisomerase I [Marinobacterium aestuariivivens]|uniref:DNA topoisomerase I n=1 Tax=Marinobacterium aestuariivivens TaxID=1698799 RepID=A0ABW2A825_9GAMM